MHLQAKSCLTTFNFDLPQGFGSRQVVERDLREDGQDQTEEACSTFRYSYFPLSHDHTSWLRAAALGGSRYNS